MFVFESYTIVTVIVQSVELEHAMIRTWNWRRTSKTCHSYWH